MDDPLRLSNEELLEHARSRADELVRALAGPQLNFFAIGVLVGQLTSLTRELSMRGLGVVGKRSKS